MIRNIIYQINFTFLKSKRVLNLIANNNEIFLKVVKIISNFNKVLKKEFSYNLNENISLSDIFSDSLPEECLKEKIKIQ